MSPQLTGFIFAIAAFIIFASQDAVSKHLGETYPAIVITMIRYWVFGGFAIFIAWMGSRRDLNVIRTHNPIIQITRGLLLATQIVTGIVCFSLIGLIHVQAVFTAAPLIIAALSVPVLGEHVGWRRWLAILVGMVGVLILIKPGPGQVSWIYLLPIANVTIGAIYAVLTRLANQTDSATTSFYYTGIVGAVVLTLIGPFFWVTPALKDVPWFVLLSIMGISSHYCLIRAYHLLDAVQVQPISYLQLVVGSIIGVSVFGEVLHLNLVIGAAIVIAAGMFTVWREAVVRRTARLDLG